MYYAKFTNGQQVASITKSGSSDEIWYIKISNGVILITNNTTFDVITYGTIKDDIIYLPLEEDNNFYYIKFSSTNFNTLYKYSNPTGWSSETSINIYDTVTITDSDFNVIGTRYYYIVGYNTASIIVLKNPLQAYALSSLTYNSSNPTYVTPASVVNLVGSDTFYQNITLSNLISSLISSGAYYLPFANEKTQANIIFNNIIGRVEDKYKSKYGYVYSYQNFCLTCSSYNLINATTLVPIQPIGIYQTLQKGEIFALDSSYSKVYLNIINDFEDENIRVYVARNDTLVIMSNTTNNYFDKDQIYVLYRASHSDSSKIVYTGFNDSSLNYGFNYQYKYTPTNKLQTLTFSDLEVLHNEESGTFALTFKINNPNEVSVSTNIHISGREDVTDITAPSGTSEWSYIIEENKDGTIQATDISALGYENADDSATYKYLAWIEPGYLRELSVDLVYLSTIDDKTYTLNVYISNNNSVTIPAVLHYGKSAELTRDITLTSGTNAIAIKGVENANGTIWIHPESVSGYYPLPDTDTYTYTKLPIPPTPATTGITLYKNNNNNKVVNKGYKLETYKAMVGNFRDKVNVLHPTFQIENDEVPDCNYCYIADFRRYYYIDTITCIRTGLYELQCSVDVLYTYKDKILSSEQYVSRQENDYNELLVDNMVTFDSTYDYVISYQNIDELDYASVNSNDTSITNIILCTFGS